MHLALVSTNLEFNAVPTPEDAATHKLLESESGVQCPAGSSVSFSGALQCEPNASHFAVGDAQWDYCRLRLGQSSPGRRSLCIDRRRAQRPARRTGPWSTPWRNAM